MISFLDQSGVIDPSHKEKQAGNQFKVIIAVDRMDWRTYSSTRTIYQFHDRKQKGRKR